MNFITHKSITSISSNQGLTQSIFKRSLFVRGKNVFEVNDPNAPTTYPVKHIFCLDRKVKGKAGAKLIRYNEFVPATISGGGLPLRNISIEWGRVCGLIQSKKFFKDRKFILNINDNEKVVGKLSYAQLHPISEKAMYLKFNRSDEDAETFKLDELPHLTKERKRQDKLATQRAERKVYNDLQNIDLSFKPVMRKSDLSKEREE